MLNIDNINNTNSELTDLIFWLPNVLSFLVIFSSNGGLCSPGVYIMCLNLIPLGLFDFVFSLVFSAMISILEADQVLHKMTLGRVMLGQHSDIQ